MTKESNTFTDVQTIIDYERGELNEDEALGLFSELVRTGMAWQLQGHYGRTAASFIEAGYLAPDGEILDHEDA